MGPTGFLMDNLSSTAQLFHLMGSITNIGAPFGTVPTRCWNGENYGGRGQMPFAQGCMIAKDSHGAQSLSANHPQFRNTAASKLLVIASAGPLRFFVCQG